MKKVLLVLGLVSGVVFAGSSDFAESILRKSFRGYEDARAKHVKNGVVKNLGFSVVSTGSLLYGLYQLVQCVIYDFRAKHFARSAIALLTAAGLQGYGNYYAHKNSNEFYKYAVSKLTETQKEELRDLALTEGLESEPAFVWKMLRTNLVFLVPGVYSWWMKNVSMDRAIKTQLCRL